MNKNVRWCVSSDAEKPLLDNIYSKQLFKKKTLTNSVSFIKFCFSRAQKHPKFFWNIPPAIFLASCCYRRRMQPAVNFVTCAFDTPCESKRSSQIFYMFVNALRIWIRRLVEESVTVYSSRLNLFYVIGEQSGHPAFSHSNLKQHIQQDLAVTMGWRFGNFVRLRGYMFWRPLADAAILQGNKFG